MGQKGDLIKEPLKQYIIKIIFFKELDRRSPMHCSWSATVSLINGDGYDYYTYWEDDIRRLARIDFIQLKF